MLQKLKSGDKWQRNRKQSKNRQPNGQAKSCKSACCQFLIINENFYFNFDFFSYGPLNSIPKSLLMIRTLVHILAHSLIFFFNLPNYLTLCFNNSTRNLFIYLLFFRLITSSGCYWLLLLR